MRAFAIPVALLVIVIAATASGDAMAQPGAEPNTADETGRTADETGRTADDTRSVERDRSGLIVPRFGTLEGTVGNDPYILGGPELSILVQPWRASSGLERGLFVSGRIAVAPGDTSEFARTGLELGYLYKSPTLLRFIKLGVAMSGTIDRWDVWRESPEPGVWGGKTTALGGSVRPFVRFGRFEVSVPFEVGYSFGPGDMYRSYGVQLGVVLF